MKFCSENSVSGSPFDETRTAASLEYGSLQTVLKLILERAYSPYFPIAIISRGVAPGCYDTRLWRFNCLKTLDWAEGHFYTSLGAASKIAA